MAANFTGLMYDNEAYNEEVARSTQPLLYRLDPNNYVNCNRCFSTHGPRNGSEVSIAIGNQIDVDSIMKGITNIHTKSNSQQKPKPLDQYKLVSPMDCPNSLETEYSRFSHPSYDIKGLNVLDMHLGYPLHDPQCQIFENFEVNTRLQSKDKHSAIWQIPLDQCDLLPTSRVGNSKKANIPITYDYAPV